MEIQAIIEKGMDGTYDVRTETDKKLDFFLLGSGNSVSEAIEDFLICDEEMRDLYTDENRNYPKLSFRYVYDLPSFLEYYSKILSYAGLQRLTGVNQGQLSQYVQGYRKPSKRTAQKIESKLHQFAEELNQVQFV